MGKMLGAYASDELDRPDLNKCPDCGCFFAEAYCPLCGKECPEDMRAGNRKKMKHKTVRSSGNGRTVFVEWYHRWWVILLMLLFFPVLGIILLATSPNKKATKILVIAIAVLWMLGSASGIWGSIRAFFDQPVNTRLTQTEYIAECTTVTPEDFYRNPSKYEGAFVAIKLTVTQRITDIEKYADGDKYSTYYICTADSGFSVLVRDCSRDGLKNFVVGDKITVYGEGDGNVTVFYSDYEFCTAPCVNGAYIALNTK